MNKLRVLLRLCKRETHSMCWREGSQRQRFENLRLVEKSQTSRGTASPAHSCHRAARSSAQKKRLSIGDSLCNPFVKAGHVSIGGMQV